MYLFNFEIFFSFLVPLITEYDKHLEELNGQLKYYQVWNHSYQPFGNIFLLKKEKIDSLSLQKH